MACLPWPTNHVKHTDLQLARKAVGGCPHAPRETGTIGPTTCKKAAGGCPHTREIQDNRTYSLQRSRRWLPTHLRNPRQPDLQLARYANTEHPDQQIASKPRVAAHTPTGIGVHREIVSSIQHTASIKHSSYKVPPGSPTGSYSCKHQFRRNIQAVQSGQRQCASGVSLRVIQLRAS